MMRLEARITLAAAGAAALALAACSGQEEEPSAAGEQNASSAELPSQAAAGETPVASIIRPGVVADPIVDLPPEPLTMTITFAHGSELRETAERQLGSLLEADAMAEGWPVVLHGHSDSEGGDAANLRTSRRRAEAVARWLTERGVAEERIRIIAFGAQNPIAPNANPDGTPNEQGRARNRRVEVVVAPGGEMPAEARDQTAVERAVQGDETVVP